MEAPDFSRGERHLERWRVRRPPQSWASAPVSLFVMPIGAGLFCTLIHNFAQPFPPISIDAKIRFLYLPFQIEPGSLILYGSV